MSDMTQEEILEGNKLIAEFMELHKDEESGNYLIVDEPHIRASCLMSIEYLRYHSSWDWLMPVVEKIEHLEETETMLGIVDINSHYCRILSLCKKQPDIIIGCYETSPEKLKCSTKIDALYQAIIKFIKWYKKQTK